MVENLKVNNIANLHVTRNITVKFLEVCNKFNNFCTLVTITTSTFLNFIIMPKASTHNGEYSYDVSWSLMKEIPKKFKSPFFVSMATAAKFVQPIPIFLAYLVPLDVDVTGNITAKICEVWSEFNIFCTFVTMATAAILNFLNSPKAATHYGGYSYKVWWK